MSTFDLFGVIRNGSPWFIINDSDHAPMNITSISTVNGSLTSGYVQINFPTGTKVGYVGVYPDEYMAQNGWTAGASVGFDNARIYFGHNGSPASPNSVPGTANSANFWVSGTMYGTADGTGSLIAPTQNGTGTGISDYTTRYVIPKTSLTLPSGTPTKIRITVKAAPSEAYTSNGVYIDHKGTGAIDFATSSPGQFLFSGSGTIALSAGQEVVSDWLTWDYNKTSDLVIGEHCSGDTSHDGRSGATAATGVGMYLKASVNEAATQTVTTASYDGPYNGYLQLVTKIETDGF